MIWEETFGNGVKICILLMLLPLKLIRKDLLQEQVELYVVVVGV